MATIAGLDIAEERAQQLQNLYDYLHRKYSYCPFCGCKLKKGHCWYSCDNEAEIIVYEGLPKPERTCQVHNESLTSDFAHTCGRCAVDYAALIRWEIRIGLRCEICGKTLQYCECQPCRNLTD